MSNAEIDLLTDKELIKLFQTGCDYAFDSLYKRHYQAVYRYLRNLTMNKEVAKDLSQDLFLKVLICFKENKFIGTDFFSQYLRRNCYFTFIEHKRKFKENVTESDFSFENFECNSGNIFQIITAKETNTQIKELFDKLPTRNKNIVDLHILYGMKFIDIAQKLNTPEKTVHGLYKTSIAIVRMAAQNSNLKSAI